MVINSTGNVIIYLYSNVQKMSDICLAIKAKPISHIYTKRKSGDSLVITIEPLTTPAPDKEENCQSKISNDEVINV